MATEGPWAQRLNAHCSARGLPQPIYQDVSDRRGGRTAWSTIATVNGTAYSARFYYACEYLAQAKEDSAEVALRNLTGSLDMRNEPPPASSYQRQQG